MWKIVLTRRKGEPAPSTRSFIQFVGKVLQAVLQDIQQTAAPADMAGAAL